VDHIESLLAQVRTILSSEENQRRLEVQRKLSRREVVYPTPFNAWDLTDGVLTVIQGWCQRLDRKLNLERIACETGPLSSDFARELVEFQLLQKIEKFRTTADDIPIPPELHTNLGLCWLSQAGPLGTKPRVDYNSGAFVAEPCLKKESDLDKLEQPHFQFDRSLHESRIGIFEEIIGGELPIVDDSLPRGWSAPFSTAARLRGDLQLLLDIKERPRFVHRLMDFIVEAIIVFNRERKQILGVEPLGAFGAEGIFGADDVNCDVFAPSVYEEFIFPYECRAATAFSSIYYHSCGNLTPLFARIIEIPHLLRIHVSPWSDLAVAVKETTARVVLEVHIFDPRINLQKFTREEMRSYVRKVTDLGTEYPLDMVVPVNTPEGQLYREIFYEETRARQY